MELRYRKHRYRGKRADNNDNKQWVYGFLWDDAGIARIRVGNGVSYAVLPDSVGEYAGIDLPFSDNLSTMLFEGDILCPSYGLDYGVIRFGEYQNPWDGSEGRHIGFYVDWVRGPNKRDLRKDLGYWVIDRSGTQLVGNVHDNPELVQEGET